MYKILIPLLATVSGCATLFSGTTQGVKITSEPAGAKVYQGGELLGTTPFEHKFKKDTFRETILTFKKDGYENKTLHLTKNLNSTALFNIGFITTTSGVTSWGIDALSGALLEYSENSYVVELRKPEKQTTSMPLEYFISNYQSIRKDLSQGGGKYLESFIREVQPEGADPEELLSKLLDRRAQVLEQPNALDAFHSAKSAMAI